MITMGTAGTAMMSMGTAAVVRGIPVYICADEFTEDQSVGMNWGPEQITAFRRDDATVFELTSEETDFWSCEAGKNYDPHHDDF